MGVSLALTATAADCFQVLLTASSPLFLHLAAFVLGACLYGNIIIYGVVGSEVAE